MFDVDTCTDYARRGRLDEWVDGYLNGGPWRNAGLREGLRRAPRWWIGPHLLPLSKLARCCGPEPDMEYRIQAEAWQRRIADIANSLTAPTAVPPLIVEWRAESLSIRDGNHRHAAMALASWTACWAIVWCNSRSDYETAQEVIARLTG